MTCDILYFDLVGRFVEMKKERKVSGAPQLKGEHIKSRK
jgi:hypothetical protein